MTFFLVPVDAGKKSGAEEDERAGKRMKSAADFF